MSVPTCAVLLIQCPHKKQTYNDLQQATVREFEASGYPGRAVGNGSDPISPSDIMKGAFKIGWMWPHLTMTVIYVGHSDYDKSSRKTILALTAKRDEGSDDSEDSDDDQSEPFIDIFDVLKMIVRYRGTNRCINVFLTSCGTGAARHAVQLLPPGSHLILPCAATDGVLTSPTRELLLWIAKGSDLARWSIRSLVTAFLFVGGHSLYGSPPRIYQCDPKGSKIREWKIDDTFVGVCSDIVRKPLSVDEQSRVDDSVPDSTRIP